MGRKHWAWRRRSDPSRKERLLILLLSSWGLNLCTTPSLTLSMSALTGMVVVGVVLCWGVVCCIVLSGVSCYIVVLWCVAMCCVVWCVQYWPALRWSVTDVWVAGKPLLRDGKFTAIDEAAIMKKAKGWGDKIKAWKAEVNHNKKWSEERA